MMVYLVLTVDIFIVQFLEIYTIVHNRNVGSDIETGEHYPISIMIGSLRG